MKNFPVNVDGKELVLFSNGKMANIIFSQIKEELDALIMSVNGT